MLFEQFNQGINISVNVLVFKCEGQLYLKEATSEQYEVAISHSKGLGHFGANYEGNLS